MGPDETIAAGEPIAPGEPVAAAASRRDGRRAPGERRGVPPVFWGLLFGCGPWLLIFFFVLLGAIGLGMRGGPAAPSGPAVGILHVTGAITSGGGGDVWSGGGGAGSERLTALLDSAAKDDGIKAIVLRIDSPGGSAVGSQEVYDDIMRIRRTTHKPIVVSMGDVAASGGYYIASSADRIFANAGTLTASIGVIMEIPQVEGLLKKVGAGLDIIKSGKFKDAGGPTRALTPEEHAMLKAMVMEIYGQFVDAVSKGRNLPRSEVLKIADGRVMNGMDALKYHLVDEIGGFRQAIDYAAKKGGIRREPVTREIGRRGFLSSLLGSGEDSSSSSAGQAAEFLRLMADPNVRQAMHDLLSTSAAAPAMR